MDGKQKIEDILLQYAQEAAREEMKSRFRDHFKRLKTGDLMDIIDMDGRYHIIMGKIMMRMVRDDEMNSRG